MTPLAAQDAGSPLLPDIDPQDIEIRGDFQARFPGIARQPILGFSPRPRVYRISPDRIPFLESAEQVVASLPMSDIDRPEGPAFHPTAFPTRHRTQAWGGFGNYVSPEGGLRMEIPAGAKTRWLVASDYASSEGSRTLIQPASYRFWNSEIAWLRRVSDRSRIKISADGRWDFNALKSTESAPAVFHRNDHSLWTADLTIEGITRRTALTATEWGLTGGTGGMELTPTAPGATATTDTETRAGAWLRHSWALAKPGHLLDLGLDSRLGFTWHQGTEAAYGVQTFAMAYRARMGADLTARVGVKTAYAWDADGNGIHVMPDLEAVFTPANGFRLSAGLSGEVRNPGSAALSIGNRFYAVQEHPLTERAYLLRGLMQYAFRTGIRFEAGLELGFHDQLGYYTRTAASPLHHTRAYSGATTVRIHGAASVDIVPERFTAFATGVVGQYELESGATLPYSEELRVGGGFSARPIGDLLIKAWGDVIANRASDGWLGAPAESAALVGAELNYRFTNRFGLYLRGTNLLNVEYAAWGAYPAPPIQAIGGFTLTF